MILASQRKPITVSSKFPFPLALQQARITGSPSKSLIPSPSKNVLMLRSQFKSFGVLARQSIRPRTSDSSASNSPPPPPPTSGDVRQTKIELSKSMSGNHRIHSLTSAYTVPSDGCGPVCGPIFFVIPRSVACCRDPLLCCPCDRRAAPANAWRCPHLGRWKSQFRARVIRQFDAQSTDPIPTLPSRDQDAGTN